MKNFNCEICREIYPFDFLSKHQPLYCYVCGQRFLAFRKKPTNKELAETTDKKAVQKSQ